MVAVMLSHKGSCPCRLDKKLMVILLVAWIVSVIQLAYNVDPPSKYFCTPYTLGERERIVR